MSSGSRIKQLRETLGLSQQAFANKLGVSRSYLGDIEVGRCKHPSTNFLQSLCDVYNVNLNWVMTGGGDVYRDSNKVASVDLDSSDSKINKMFEQLTVEQQQIVFNITQEMIKINVMEERLEQLTDKIDFSEKIAGTKE